MHPERVKIGFKGTNRRATQRYAISRKMAYCLTGDTEAQWQQSKVLDMSARGIRFETSRPLPNGTLVDLVMDWPGIYHGRNEVRLFLSGTVCRSAPDDTALQILDHDFRFTPVEMPKRHRRTERRISVARAS